MLMKDKLYNIFFGIFSAIIMQEVLKTIILSILGAVAGIAVNETFKFLKRKFFKRK
jgi:hypothetical protein